MCWTARRRRRPRTSEVKGRTFRITITFTARCSQSLILGGSCWRRAGRNEGSDKCSLTAAPVSIDPYVVASRHETVFEGSQVKGARRRRCRDAQGGGREDLLCVDAHHKALDKEASRDRGRGARADPRQALQERSDA